MFGYPDWFMKEVAELEEALADGHIGHTDFNLEMEYLEEQLNERENPHAYSEWAY